MNSDIIESLIKSMQQLPGIGNKSAKRLALHILKNKNTLLSSLLNNLTLALEKIKQCKICFNISEHDPCHICCDNQRETNKICIVKDVADLWVLENSKTYNGLYHVLGGNLSALDNKKPEDLNIEELLQRVTKNINEIIIATDATIAGQTTAYYIADLFKSYNIKISRLAFGIPVGGELDYLDEGTLRIAIEQRNIFQ